MGSNSRGPEFEFEVWFAVKVKALVEVVVDVNGPNPSSGLSCCCG